ncbi:MAG: hypothetical protein PF487_14340 [Bacteroidales bacterium]|nr:hypothetical protein [Bacteroidales bacterium]
MVADEVVHVLRKVRNKDIADKYYLRVLKTFREPQINLICRNHNIEIKEQTYESKVKQVIKKGISISTLLQKSVHKDGTTIPEKKKFINELWKNGLQISSTLHGVTLDEKISNLITYFEEIERDEKVGISIDGYEKLLIELGEVLPNFKKKTKLNLKCKMIRTLIVKAC